MQGFQFCSLHPTPRPMLPRGLDSARERSIVLTDNKWMNGTRITYYFRDVGPHKWPESQKQAVRDAFAFWKSLGIGLEFAETASSSDAILLIGLVQGDGSWSYVGTDVLHHRRFGCNMNFGWDLRTDWGKATAIHEIGHAIGMPHEHQNPNSGIVWNEAAVIEYFTGPPNNWSEEQIRYNILRHLEPGEVEGSSWDPHSVMHYGFDASMIEAPPPYDDEGIPPNFEPSDTDRAWAARFYPPISAEDIKPIEIGEKALLAATPSEQVDFVFTPNETRQYRLQSSGNTDRRIAIGRLREDGSSEVIEVADDSGTDDSAQIVRQLVAGETYRISARTHFAQKGEKAKIVIE